MTEINSVNDALGLKLKGSNKIKNDMVTFMKYKKFNEVRGPRAAPSPAMRQNPTPHRTRSGRDATRRARHAPGLGTASGGVATRGVWLYGQRGGGLRLGL